MQVILKVGNEKANVRQIVLQQDTVIGRNQDCHLKVASSQVSRRHCQISIRGHQVTIRDLNSSNGTLVNGLPIPADIDVPLSPGTQVGVGPLVFTVLYDLSSASLAPSLADTHDWAKLPTATTSPPQTQLPQPVEAAAEVRPSGSLSDTVDPAAGTRMVSPEIVAQYRAEIGDTASQPDLPAEETAANEFDFLSGSSATEETPAVAEATSETEAPSKKKRGFLDFLGLGKRKSAQPEQTLSATPTPEASEAENSTPQSGGDIPDNSEIPAAASGSAPEEASVSDAEPAIVGETPESEEEASANDDPLSSFLQGFQP